MPKKFKKSKKSKRLGGMMKSKKSGISSSSSSSSALLEPYAFINKQSDSSGSSDSDILIDSRIYNDVPLKSKSKSKSKSEYKFRKIKEKTIENKIERLELELQSIRDEERKPKSEELTETLQEIEKLSISTPNILKIIDVVKDKIYNSDETEKQKIFDNTKGRNKFKSTDGTWIKYEYIASGNYGNIYKYYYKGETAVLKVINIKRNINSLTGEYKNEIQREIFILNALSGIPNFLKYHSLIIHGTRAFIFMECFNGIPLHEWFDNFKITPTLISWGIDTEHKAATTLFDRLCLSVYNMHQENIVHNDLNSGNILVNLDTMDLRIIDFGFSRCYGDYKRHGICKKMDEKLKYEYPQGYSGGYTQMAPWRSKNCNIGGCTFLDLKRGDYWAIFMLFNNIFKLDLEQYGKEITSDKFSKDIPSIYSKITGDTLPDYLILDIN
jgi:tRNA A-37 threonylcarbamoyl transferase component Bud32